MGEEGRAREGAVRSRKMRLHVDVTRVGAEARSVAVEADAAGGVRAVAEAVAAECGVMPEAVALRRAADDEPIACSQSAAEAALEDGARLRAHVEVVHTLRMQSGGMFVTAGPMPQRADRCCSTVGDVKEELDRSFYCRRRDVRLFLRGAELCDDGASLEDVGLVAGAEAQAMSPLWHAPVVKRVRTFGELTSVVLDGAERVERLQERVARVMGAEPRAVRMLYAGKAVAPQVNEYVGAYRMHDADTPLDVLVIPTAAAPTGTK